MYVLLEQVHQRVQSNITYSLMQLAYPNKQ